MIFKLRDLIDVEELGGTMRLGAWACNLAERSWRARFTRVTKSASAIVIALSSIRSFVRAWRVRAWFLVACHRTESSWKWSSLPVMSIPGFWVASFIRNTNQNR